MNHILGWAALAGLIVCFAGYKLKRLRFHCTAGFVALILAILHTAWNIVEENTGYLGYICLAVLALVIISGTICKCSKKLSAKGRANWRSSHQIITVFLLLVLILHIINYFIMS